MAPRSDVPDAAALARLRERLSALADRRAAAAERTPQSNPARVRELEAMRFELAEVAWRLAQLEAIA
jgi:hypothetical protein